MTVKYKLTMVEERAEHYADAKDSKVTMFIDVCTIGTFDSEKKLAQWAEENDGCLESENAE